MVSYYPLEFLLATTLLLTICVTITDAELKDAMQPLRTIPQGTLLGTTIVTRYGRKINSFLGIPYAQPPTGKLRFANPVAAGGWNDILNATVKQSDCPQISITSQTLVGDEDCLYLNVYTPQLFQDGSSLLLPVMVYIHGGGFHGNFPGPSGPEYLLDKNVILVTMNFRLGPLGFLSTGDEVASGNWGLKDAVLALQWVQSNIRYFGGDPDQVTLFGESTGAGSVSLLALSSTTIGLFHKYITQSGTALGMWAHRPRGPYSKRAFELGEYVGCHNDTSKPLISCLRTIDCADIINTVPQFIVWEFLPEIVWGPTDEPNIEGAFLTDSPKNIFAAQGFRDLPWMNGVNLDEGLLYTARLHKNKTIFYDFLKHIDALLPLMLYWTYQPDSGAAWINATKSYYFNDLTADTNLLLKNLTMLITDVYFFHPGDRGLMKQYARATSPLYFYLFDYRGTFSFSYTYGENLTANVGISHSDDLIYLFPKQSEFVALDKMMSKSDYEMVDEMVELWTSFAINGKPTASGLGNTRWERFSMKDTYFRLGSNSVLDFENQDPFFRERMQFWDDVYGGTKTQDSDHSTSSQKVPPHNSGCRLKIRSNKWNSH